MNFTELGLSQALVEGLSTLEITQPTAVQQAALPQLLNGKDMILQSQTGSGKTLAYLLPLYQRQGETVEKGAQAIILVPTRELAMQVHKTVQDFSKASGIDLQSIALFANVNIQSQIEKLRDKPQIIIGTADRILALIEKRKIPAHLVKTLIIDEADRLTDKFNWKTLQAVRKTLMKYTQVVFASATFSPDSVERIRTMAPTAVLSQTTVQEEIPENITHMALVTRQKEKLEKLRKLIGIVQPTRSIIFINKLEEIEIAVEKLQYHKLSCACVHSESTKEERQLRLQAFKEGKLQHLVCTDLMARGLHVDDVPCVFHVDIAENPADYLHRAGRAGRNGAPALSISICEPHELQYLTKCRSRYGIKIEAIDMYEGRIVEAEKPKPRHRVSKKRK